MPLFGLRGHPPRGPRPTPLYVLRAGCKLLVAVFNPPPHISPRARCDVYSLTEKLNFAGSRADKNSVCAQTRQTKLIVGKSLILRYLAPLQSTAPSSEFNVDMTRAQEAKVNLRLSLSFGCRGFIGPWLTSTAFDAGELFFRASGTLLSLPLSRAFAARHRDFLLRFRPRGSLFSSGGLAALQASLFRIFSNSDCWVRSAFLIVRGGGLGNTSCV